MFVFIERLILFLVLISAIRSAIGFVQRLWQGLRGGAVASHRPAPRQAAPATMLHQDPVCGTYVAVDTSLKRIVSGRVIHFCSPECRDRYTV